MNDDRKTKKQLVQELRELRSSLQENRNGCGELHYRAMIEHMASGFVVYDVSDEGRHFIIREYNPAAERLNGVRREDVVGKDFREFNPKVDASAVRAAMRRVWRTGRTERVPAQYYDFGPRPTWREYIAYKLPSGQVALIIDDVTAREEAAQEARDKADLLQATLDAVNDGLWEYLPAEGLFQCSDRLAAMLERPRREILRNGPLCSGLLHPEDRPRLDAALDRCLDGQSERLGLELRIKSPEGAWKWFYMRGSVVERDESGRALRIIGAHTDLSEFKRAQRRLRESLELFSNIFENAYTTMLLIDPDTGRIVEANAKADAFYGYTRDQLKSMTIMDINTLTKEELTRELAQAKSSGCNMFRFQHRRASGEIRDVEVHCGPVHFRDRDLLYSIVHDVTDRLRAEEALRLSEATLSGIFSAAPVGIGTVRNRVLGTVNEALCDMLGYEANELRGKSARILYPSEQEFRRVCSVNFSIAERHGRGTVETVFRAKDGGLLNVLLGFSWLDPADRERGMVLTVLDITERRRAEEEITRVRRGMHQLVDSMPSALFVIDDRAVVTLCNEAAARLCDRREEELTGQPFRSALPGFSDFAGLLEETLETGRPLMRKALPRSIGESLRFWDLLVYPLDEGGPGRAVVRLDDVSDRMLMEEAMIQNEKMMSVGGLAAGMAHEINNPLAGILQGAQNIARRLDPGLEANRRAADALGCDLDDVLAYVRQRRIPRFLDGITAAGQRAAEIVTNMLNFSRDGHTMREPLNLVECVEQSVQLATNGYDLGRRYDFKNIEVVRDFAPGEVMVHGAMTELQQVFLNLLINAAHAMADKIYDGEPPRLTLSCHAENGWAVASVADNGPGIPDETRPRIFDPFFTTKAPGQGTGLGLSVSYFIVTRNHGGSIAVDTQPGEYTRFTVTLPLVQG